MVDVCYRRAGDDVYMIAYIQADRPASVDLYLWLKDGTGSTVLYPADKAVAWTGLAVRSTQVREETRIAVRLTKGAQYFVCFQDFPAGSPAPKIRNSTTGRQVGFTY
ncbi:hypothetical protein KSE_13010 [Kitasatospora setae KM-6054]|uniref:Uncharacterized protein n=2 Tax=Streptomycetaceae TaxID=2062 RepID=E4N7F0_KITSK|nr:hypothetical protein KSE_13010 [Kitasatospora setae KM-6054]